MLAFAGCSSSTSNEIQDTSTIVVWHWLSDRVNVFDKLADEYQSLTGIKIKFELYAPTAAYTSKVRSAAQANKLPDVYGGGLFEMRDFAAFIKAGHVYDLTPFMVQHDNKWKNIFFDSGLALNSLPEGNEYNVTPGIYGAPIDINDIQMVYNLDLLKQAGWANDEPPATWEEFIQLGQMLKDKDIPGLVSGWGETWMLQCLADNFAWNIMGKEKIIATLQGKVPYTDPDWVKVFQLFKDMVDIDMFFPGSVTMVNKEAEQIFANNKAAVAFNGSWCVNVYDGMNPDLNYVAALPPRIDLNNKMYIWGGCTSFVVNDASANKDKAVEFLKWLTEDKQQEVMVLATNNIPASKASIGALKGNIKGFADDIENIVHPKLLPLEEYPLVTEAFNKGIQSIIIGEMTPEQVAENVQNTKEKEAKKAERFRKIREQRQKELNK
ncbi:MAG: extracellular solute-binding protein [Candidatus Omnitrophica bacterium]|nr:extracellular solute-binding protein [Candidatus Omnitrophota bacterium]